MKTLKMLIIRQDNVEEEILQKAEELSNVSSGVFLRVGHEAAHRLHSQGDEESTDNEEYEEYSPVFLTDSI